MFIEEVHRLFRLEYDKWYSNAMPELERREIDYVLNKTLIRFVKTRYNLNNIYKKGFEQSQKRTDDLRTFVKTCYFQLSSATTEGSFNINSIDLRFPYLDISFNNKVPYKYMYYLNGFIRLTKSVEDICGNISTISGDVSIKIISSEELYKSLNDPYNKPGATHTLAVFQSNNLVTYCSSDLNTVLAKISFLKQPNKIVSIVNPTTLTGNTVMDSYTLYEVISGTVSYLNREYNVGDWFETTDVSTPIGSAVIRLFTGIELPDYVVDEVITLAVKNSQIELKDAEGLQLHELEVQSIE